MLYIGISIMFVWLIVLIFIPITHYCLFCAFLPLPKYRKQSSKILITISGIVVNYILSSTVLFFFGNSSTTFRKLSTIYCKYYYYGWIHITDVFLLIIIRFQGFNCLQKQNYLATKTSRYFAYWLQALNMSMIRGSSLLLRVSLVYCLNSTSTEVTKFSLVW